MENNAIRSIDSKDDQNLRSMFLDPKPKSKRTKKAPEIFDDPEELANAFLNTVQEPVSPEEIRMKYILLVLAKGCTTWKDFIARLKKAKKEEKDKNTLASLKYLENTAMHLKGEEEKTR